MKPELENLKEYTQKTSLTQEEKFAMLSNLRTYTDTHSVRSPYSILFKHSFAYATMCALIIGTTATSFAAERALPGDILYPVKTEINENIAKSLSVTKEQKAKINVKLVDKRMEELTEMVVTKQDTPEKIDIVVAKLEEHKQEIQEYVSEVQESDIKESEIAVAIYTELESVVDAHIDILEDIAEDTKKDEVVVAKENPKDTQSTSISISLPVLQENVPVNSTTTPIKELTGEEDALSEVVEFSEQIEPIGIEVKSKAHKEDEATSTKIKEDTRKRIIESVEEELEIKIEEPL